MLGLEHFHQAAAAVLVLGVEQLVFAVHLDLNPAVGRIALRGDYADLIIVVIVVLFPVGPAGVNAGIIADKARQLVKQRGKAACPQVKIEIIPRTGTNSAKSITLKRNLSGFKSVTLSQTCAKTQRPWVKLQC